MKTKFTHARGNGFSLVELLVTVSIVGILASILIPVVGGVRGKTDRMKVTTNLRTMGNASLLYAVDHQWFPGANGSRLGRVRSPLTIKGVKYEKASDYQKLQPMDGAHLAEKLYGYTEVADTFENPLAEGQYENGWSYVQNRDVYGYIRSGLEPLSYFKGQTMDAANVWSIADIDTIMPSPPSRGNMPVRRVGDERAYLFLDGHVDWVTIEAEDWHPEAPE